MPTGRFAPSPTGRMHLGNAYSALLSWLSAKSEGGRWLLRIEDIDPQRSRPEYARLLMDDLQWLGLPWDGDPVFQSQRGDLYAHYCEQLTRRGLTYPCFCTRADLLATQAPHEADGRVVYAGTCRPRTPAAPPADSPSAAPLPPHATPASPSPAPLPPHAIRLQMPHEQVTFTDGHYGTHTIDLARHVGDFIIRRKDGAWAYQLAVVVDDALMGVTQVVRGRDLLLSSPQQICVARLLGFTPPRFAHLPLLLNSGGQRLSKRDRSQDMAVLRQHYTAPQLVGLLAHLAGLLPRPEAVTPQQLLPLFSWSSVPRHDIVVPATPFVETYQ